jgi:hypothetical protein
MIIKKGNKIICKDEVDIMNIKYDLKTIVENVSEENFEKIKIVVQRFKKTELKDRIKVLQ